MSKYCLLIDDNKEEVNDWLDGVDSGKIIPGDTVEFLCLEPLRNAKGIDVSRTIDFIFENISRKRPDIIACDFDLGDGNFWGIDIITHIRKKYQHQNCLLYSANLHLVCQHVNIKLRIESDLADESIALDALKSLAFVNECFKRDDTMNRIIYWLKQPDYAHVIVLKEMARFKGALLKNGFLPFHGKTFEDICGEIEHETPNGKKFVYSIIRDKIHSMVEE